MQPNQTTKNLETHDLDFVSNCSYDQVCTYCNKMRSIYYIFNSSCLDNKQARDEIQFLSLAM